MSRNRRSDGVDKDTMRREQEELNRQREERNRRIRERQEREER